MKGRHVDRIAKIADSLLTCLRRELSRNAARFIVSLTCYDGCDANKNIKLNERSSCNHPLQDDEDDPGKRLHGQPHPPLLLDVVLLAH